MITKCVVSDDNVVFYYDNDVCVLVISDNGTRHEFGLTIEDARGLFDVPPPSGDQEALALLAELQVGRAEVLCLRPPTEMLPFWDVWSESLPCGVPRYGAGKTPLEAVQAAATVLRSQSNAT